MDIAEIREKIRWAQKAETWVTISRDDARVICDSVEEQNKQLAAKDAEIATMRRALEMAFKWIGKDNCTHYPGYVCDKDFETPGICAKCFMEYFIQQAKDERRVQ